MTNKDVMFITIAIIWLASNIGFYIMLGTIGIALSNFIFISIMLILIWMKKHNKFGNWLERKIR